MGWKIKKLLKGIPLDANIFCHVLTNSQSLQLEKITTPQTRSCNPSDVPRHYFFLAGALPFAFSERLYSAA